MANSRGRHIAYGRKRNSLSTVVSCGGEIEQRGNHKDGLEKKKKKEKTRFNQRGKFLNIGIIHAKYVYREKFKRV